MGRCRAGSLRLRMFTESCSSDDVCSDHLAATRQVGRHHPDRQGLNLPFDVTP